MEDTNNNVGGVGTAVANGNSGLLAELDQKLTKIEARLAQIAGYKFIPPSIKEEKESLQRQKDILMSTRSRLEKTALTAPPPKPQPPVAPPQAAPTVPPIPSPVVPSAAEPPKGEITAPIAPPVNTSPAAPAPVMTDIIPAPPLEPMPAPQDEPVKVEKPVEKASEKAVPLDTSFEEALETIETDEVPTAPRDTSVYQNQKKNNEKRFFDHKKEEKADPIYRPHGSQPDEGGVREIKASLGQVSASAEALIADTVELVSACKKVLDVAIDNLDRDYLAKVVETLDKSVGHLREKANKVEMSAERKSQAVKARVALYVKIVRDEFDLSDLLNDELKAKIAKITQ